jgi:hypothetical protein
MKRNYTIERALRWHLRTQERRPKTVIPPKSLVRLTKREPDWDEELKIGETFRIGYYSKQDGPNCVWLVNDTGRYGQTWDQESLLDYFEVVSLSDETDTYGTRRSALEPQ